MSLPKAKPSVDDFMIPDTIVNKKIDLRKKAKEMAKLKAFYLDKERQRRLSYVR